MDCMNITQYIAVISIAGKGF